MLEPNTFDPFDSDEDGELGIDYHVSNMGPEFFQPEEQAPTDTEELGAGFSLSGHVAASASGGAKAGGTLAAHTKRKHTAKRIAAVKAWLKSSRHPDKHTAKSRANLAAFFKMRLKTQADLWAIYAVADAWLKVKPAPMPAPKPAPKPAAPAPVVTPARRAPVMSPVLRSLRPRFVATPAPRVRRTVMLPAKDLRVRPDAISPVKLLLKQKGLVCHCPEHHLGDPEKKVVKLLAEVKRQRIQREATSEHHSLMSQAEFRTKILRLLQRCVGNGGRSGAVPGSNIRDKCFKTRVCT